MVKYCSDKIEPIHPCPCYHKTAVKILLGIPVGLPSKRCNLLQGSGGQESAPSEALGASTAGGVVNVDNEESLLVVRASAGSADATVGGPHLSASFAIGRFEIEDLLVGPKCRSHKYLARSFEPTITGTQNLHSLPSFPNT